MPSQQVQPFINVGNATSASCSSGACSLLETGVVYVVTVRAWNGAGEYTDTLSDGIMVDLSLIHI